MVPVPYGASQFARRSIEGLLEMSFSRVGSHIGSMVALLAISWVQTDLAVEASDITIPLPHTNQISERTPMASCIQ